MLVFVSLKTGDIKKDGYISRKEESELDKMDKALADKATTKEELEVMVDIYCSFIGTGFYLFLDFRPLPTKQLFSSKIPFLMGFFPVFKPLPPNSFVSSISLFYEGGL